MKRLLLSFLLILSLALSSCTPHQHKFSALWSFDSVGHWHKAQCGHAEERTDYNEHIWESKVLREATCTTEGKQLLRCTVCAFEKEKAIPFSHRLIRCDAKVPSCKEAGWEAYWACEACDYSEKEEKKLPHSFAGGVCRLCGACADTSWYQPQQSQFILSSADELRGLRDLVNSGTDFQGKTIYLACDLSLNGEEWIPIGDSFERAFRGTFCGLGHVISDFSVRSEENSAFWYEYAGLFGCVTGDLKQLGVKGVTVDISSANRLCAGALVGYSEGTVSQCFASHSQIRIQSEESADAGGLVGWAERTVSECYADVSLEALSPSSTAVGGLVGRSGRFTLVQSCFALGSVSGSSKGLLSVAGVICAEKASMVVNCYRSASQTIVCDANGTLSHTPSRSFAVTVDPSLLLSPSFLFETLHWDLSHWKTDENFPSLIPQILP